ncbi:ASCH domain-containing protein [Paenibacillus sp. y28]|uniref:ASCH domain-containing protein n=1 Tax=Paenibacillus sp. y28 TaxID=3129110 RepID=UPI00301A80C2
MSTAALPPKTCTIERLVTKQEDIDRVLRGEKTATRRNGRYADPGEKLVLGSQTFEVTRVYQQSLGELTDEHARTEGFATMEQYKEYILSLHAGMPWIPQAKVWVHEFKAI